MGSGSRERGPGSSNRPVPSPSPAPGRREPLPAPSEYHRQMRRAALMSVYRHAHARPGEDDGMPAVLRPVPVDTAVAYLTTQEPEPRFRHHAAAWLVDDPQRDGDHLVRRLVGPERQERLRAHLAAAASRRAEAAARGGRRGTRAAVRSRAAVEVPASDFGEALHFLTQDGDEDEAVRAERTTRAVGGPALAGTARCSRSNFHIETHLDPVTAVTSVVCRVDASCDCTKPDLEPTYRKMCDPQGWKLQAPMYFVHSDKYFEADACYYADPHPPPLGTPWQGLIYEEVTMSPNPAFPIVGHNVLRGGMAVRPPPDPLDPDDPTSAAEGTLLYKMSCSLSQSLETTMGFSRVEGGIDVDAGSLAVIALPGGGTRLISKKRARFSERQLWGVSFGYWLNVVAQYWLGPWLGLMIYEGACA